MVPKEQYSSDAPIQNSNYDKFNRFPFAQRVAKVISKRKDPSSLIIGIYGAWGEGKTSVLNFMEKELEKEKHVVCLKFNPWRFGEEDEMLINFFYDLAKALDSSLDTKGEKIGTIVEKFLPSIAKVTGQESLGNALMAFIPKSNIDELRERIESILYNAGKRVVILVDDIDRLEKDEIHSVFRLVKLTADFENTAYVLAFDNEMVSAALQERYSSTKNSSGKSFLEKIIQVPLQLPAISTIDLRRYSLEGISEALVLAEIEMTSDEVQNFLQNFNYFLQRLKTPRQAKLYTNILSFSLPILKNEVNTVDIMLLEGLRIFYPDSYEFIFKYNYIFLEKITERNKSDIEPRKNKLISLLNMYSNEEANSLRQLLVYLFPYINTLFNNSFFGDGWEKEWNETKRICSKRYFQRYFSYAITADDISDNLIDSFLTQVKIEDVTHLTKVFKSIINEQNAEAVIYKIQNRVNKMDAFQLEKISLILANIGHLLPNPKTLIWRDSPFKFAAILISKCIEEIDQKEMKESLAIKILENTKALDFATECFRNFPKNVGHNTNPNGFTLEELKPIGLVFSQLIIDHLQRDKFEMLKYKDYLREMFFCAVEYEKSDDLHKIVKSVLEENPFVALEIIKSYCGTVFLSTGGTKIGEFERDEYNSISKVIDPNIFADILNKTYPEIQIPDQYPYNDDQSDRTFIQQFLWIHNAVTMKE